MYQYLAVGEVWVEIRYGSVGYARRGGHAAKRSRARMKINRVKMIGGAAKMMERKETQS